MSLKVATGADTSVITTTDLQHFPFPINIFPCSNVLKGYRGFIIENIGAAILNISFKGKSINAKFNIVEAPGSPCMLGCRQCQELAIITANMDEVNTSLSTGNQPKNTPETETGMQHGQLSKSTVLEEYPDCFDKLGRFRGEKYHIQLVDNPVPVVCPHALHILPLYKEELDKMIADDVFTAVTESTA